jgi:hypothetical protein
MSEARRRRLRPWAAGGEPAAPESVPPARDRSWLRENLEHSLPFVVGGAVCLGLAVAILAGHPHTAPGRPQLWALLAGLGVTLEGGGVVLTIVEDPSEAREGAAAAEYVQVLRSDWERLQPYRGTSTEEQGPEEPSEDGYGAGGPAAVPAVASSPSQPSASFDALSVARASDQLLAQPARAVGVPVPPPSSPAPTARAEPPPASAPPSSWPPAPAVQAPTPSTAVRSPPPPPIWQEEPIQELESLLAQLEAAKAGPDRPVAPAAVPATLPSRAPQPMDRCASCGVSTVAYSEQTCVVCGRALCDRCLEQSVAALRPSICPGCHASSPV